MLSVRNESANRPGSSPTRVAIIAAHSVVSESLAARLAIEPDLHALAVLANAERAAHSAVELGAEVVVLDTTPGLDSTKELVRELTGHSSELRVVVLVSEGDVEMTAKLLSAGASSAVLTSASTDELVTAIRWASTGAAWISPPLLGLVLSQMNRAKPNFREGRLGALTDREREVLQLMVDGRERQQLAEQLFLSTATVRTHMRNLMVKLDAHTATAAVSTGLTEGLRPAA